MSAHNLSNYLTLLSKTPDYEHIFIKAKQLIEIQKALLKAIPAQLQEHCAVGRYADGLLLIYVNSGAVAARLRNALPSIHQQMNKDGFDIHHIKISLQPSIHPGSTRNPSRKPRLSRAAADHLNQFTANLPPQSPLKSSLELLLAPSKSTT
ncbi:DciA family protein [Nitrosomonas sp. ANs5]|uniref:DciA family protein n=1 Tax=Nitrosomonas sp. ANs5 TaxID=3423941 RepID=UPI003D355DD2